MTNNFKPGSLEDVAYQILSEANPSVAATRLANQKTGTKYAPRYVALIKSLSKLPWTSKPETVTHEDLTYFSGMFDDKKVTFSWRDPGYTGFFEFEGANVKSNIDKKSGISFSMKNLGPVVHPVRDADPTLVPGDLEKNLKDFKAAIDAAKKLS